MKIGFGVSKITPPYSMKMAGYTDRHKAAVGVHDELFVKCILINGVAIFSYDLLGISSRLFNEIRLKLPEAILTATHTHSAPILTPKYVDFLLRRTLKAYNTAKESVKDMGICFSKFKVRNVCGNRVSSRLLGGDEVAIFACDKGGMIIYGCHPTVLGPDNLLYSSDLAGALTISLEKKYGGIFLFLNSCAADVSTRFTREARTFSEIDVLEKKFSKQLPGSFEKLQENVRIEKIRDILKYKLKNPNDPMWNGIDDGKKYLNAGRDILTDEKMAKQGKILFEVEALKIGKTVVMFYPFELQTFTCKRIKGIGEKYGIEVFIVGYSNGYNGYLPARESWGMRTYENLVSAFDEKAEEKILKLTKEVLKRACIT